MEKELILSALVSNGGNVQKASKQLGVSSSALYKCLSDETLKIEYNAIKNEMLTSACDDMRCVLKKAVKVLENVIDDENSSAQIKINAVDCLFRNFYRTNEQVEIITRLDSIEKRLGNNESSN